jgi:hypothetical protein
LRAQAILHKLDAESRSKGIDIQQIGEKMDTNTENLTNQFDQWLLNGGELLKFPHAVIVEMQQHTKHDPVVAPSNLANL